MDLYREDVMDHYEHPRNQGEIDPSAGSGQVVEGRDSNASCGDMIQFSIRTGKSQTIEEVKWKGIGCAITTAAASKLSEYLKGKSIESLRAISDEEMAAKGIGIEVNPGRIKCLMLPVKVVKKILSKA